jgi:hypothetical protein
MSEPTKTVYIAMRALPWDRLNVALPAPPDANGNQPSVTAKGDDKRAGFLPIYWSQEAAEADNPGVQIQVGTVDGSWGQAVLSKQDTLNRPDFEKLDKDGLIDFARKIETRLAPERVKELRGEHLNGRRPGKRHSQSRLIQFILACQGFDQE